MIQRCIVLAMFALIIPATAVAEIIYIPIAIYQPVASDDDPVIAIPGHGEHIRIRRDWALIQCSGGERMLVEQVNETLIVRCGD